MSEHGSSDHWNTLAEQIGAEINAPAEKPAATKVTPSQPKPRKTRSEDAKPAAPSTDWSTLASELGSSAPPAKEAEPVARQAEPAAEPATQPVEEKSASRSRAGRDGDEREQRPKRRRGGRGRRGGKQREEEQRDTEQRETKQRPEETQVRSSGGFGWEEPDEPESQTTEKSAQEDTERGKRRGRRRRGRGKPDDRHRERRGEEESRGSDEVDFESISQLPESDQAAEFGAGLDVESDAEESEQPTRRRRRRRGGRKNRKGDKAESRERSDDERDDTDTGGSSDELDDQVSKNEDDSADDGDEKKRGRRRGRRRGGKGRTKKDSPHVSVSGSADDFDLLDEDDDADMESNPEGADKREGGKRHRNITSWQEAAGVIVDRNLGQRSKGSSKGNSKGRRGRRSS